MTVSSTRTRTREPDQACAEAVDLARAAIVAIVGPDQVGEHLDVLAEGERVVVGNLDQFRPGQKIQPKDTQAGAGNPSGDR